MSSLLAGAAVATHAEKNTDRLGGFQLLDSGIHMMTIELAYLHQSKGGARAIEFSFKSDKGTLRSTQYFTSGTEKGCKTYYEKDGKQYNLPGFIVVEDIFKVVTGGGLENAVVEPKVIKKYNKEAGGEVNTNVQMITNLLGQQVALGVLKQTVDKTALGGDNEYHPTGETRDINELDKVFHLDGRTVVEVEAGVTEADFAKGWKAKYDGQVINKAKGAGQGGTSGAPTAAAAPKKLFK